jgi:hypothetical protein
MQDYVWTGEIGIQYHIFAESEEQARQILLTIYSKFQVDNYFSKYKLSVKPMPNGFTNYGGNDDKVLCSRENHELSV